VAKDFGEMGRPQELAALGFQSGNKESEGTGTRTLDLRIKSPLLYRLSYALDHPKTL
jgi:hypothetical protein